MYLTFLTLCIVSRFAYSLNDIFTGRLARRYGRLEVAAWRGLLLGLTMSPLLFWVPAEAWTALGQRWPKLLLMVSLTATANLLQNHAARLLPFGLRASFMITGTSVGALLAGWLVFDERLTWLQGPLAIVLIASAVIAALGTHAAHEIQPDVRRGGLFMGVMAALMAIIAVLLRDLAEETHPLLMAWAWEFGAGVVLIGPLLWIYRRGCGPFLPQRIWQIALASSPTVVGSGANVMALTLGKLGLWGALGGTQVLFTAVLGAWWHRETVGARRWLCFAAAAAAIAVLSVAR